jgi:hypothetical protein
MLRRFNMNVEKLKEIERNIEKEIKKYGKRFNEAKEIICDGIVSEELYLKSKYKIMWLLKEPYGEGGYKLGTDLVNEKDRIRDSKIPSIKMMAYVTYGILNNKHFQEIENLKSDPDVIKILTHIAWVNINKIPGKTKSGDMIKEYNFWKKIIFKQIKHYEPRIIIFGGTFHHFIKDWEIFFNYRPVIRKKSLIKYCSNDNQLLITTYHPTYPEVYGKKIISPEEYVNNIVDIVNEEIP